MLKTFKVDENYQNSRFDKWFRNKVIDIPHSLIEKIIRLNKVKVNNKKRRNPNKIGLHLSIECLQALIGIS